MRRASRILLPALALAAASCVAPQEVRPPFVSEKPLGSALGGTITFATQADAGHALLDVSPSPGAKETVLVPGKAPAWSPDGARLAYAAATDGAPGIFVRDTAGQSRPIATEPGFYDSPAWSPDGSQIAFAYAAGAGASWDLVVAAADGSGRRLVVGSPAQDWHPAWSPDGSTIAFVSNRDGDNAIWSLDMSTGAQTKIIDGEKSDEQPAFSPDGSTIAFTSNRTLDRWQVYLYDRASRQVRQLVRSDTMDRFPSWSPDGNHILVSVGYLSVYRADGKRFENGADRWRVSDRLALSSSWRATGGGA